MYSQACVTPSLTNCRAPHQSRKKPLTHHQSLLILPVPSDPGSHESVYYLWRLALWWTFPVHGILWCVLFCVWLLHPCCSTCQYFIPFYGWIMFHYSLVAQRIKHLPAIRETQVWSLGWEDPLEKEMATHSSVLAWRIRGWRSLVGCSPWGHK